MSLALIHRKNWISSLPQPHIRVTWTNSLPSHTETSKYSRPQQNSKSGAASAPNPWWGRCNHRGTRQSRVRQRGTSVISTISTTTRARDVHNLPMIEVPNPRADGDAVMYVYRAWTQEEMRSISSELPDIGNTRRGCSCWSTDPNSTGQIWEKPKVSCSTAWNWNGAEYQETGQTQTCALTGEQMLCIADMGRDSMRTACWRGGQIDESLQRQPLNVATIRPWPLCERL